MNLLFTKLESIYTDIENKIGLKNIRILYFLVTVFLSSGICFLGVYSGHDVKFHLSRVISVADCLKNGVFPGIIYPNYLEGYGYANGAFYPDLFLYIPALLIVAGVKSEIAYNIFLILINITAVFTTYLCIKCITKNDFCGLLAGRLVVLSPYYLTDAYLRSALGEHLSFAFLPLVVLGMYNLFYGDYKKGGIYFTVGLVCILYSHILSVLLCALFIVVFGVLNLNRLFRERERFYYCIIYGLLAIGIGAYVCLPMLEMMQSDLFLYKVNPFSSQNMAPRAVPLYRLFLDYTADTDPWFPMGVGIVSIVLFVLCAKQIVTSKESESFILKLIITGLIFLVCSSVLFPWKYINILNILQFPWRLFQISTICFAIGFSCYLSKKCTTKKQIIINQIIVMPFILFSLMCFGYYTLQEGFEIGFTRNWGYKISQGEYLPADLGGEFHEDREFGKEYVETRGTIIESNHNFTYSFSKNGTDISVEYSENSNDDTYIDLPLIYYKGYRAVCNGELLNTYKGNTGLVRVDLPRGNGIVDIKYAFTTIRTVSAIITACSLCATLLLCAKNRIKKD